MLSRPIKLVTLSSFLLGIFLFFSSVVSSVESTYQPLKNKLEFFFKETFDSEKNATDLCKIMTKQGSDKGGIKHNYTQLYHYLFKEFKDKSLKIFEVGLGTNFTDVPSNMGKDGIPGASLRGWKAYFPNSEIYGADVDKRILFKEEGIRTFYVDQLLPDTIRDMWGEIGDAQFDVIIDDGLHNFSANITFLDNSFERLNVGGYYIIEDIIGGDNYQKISEHLKNKYPSSALITLPHSQNNLDNCVAVIIKTS